MIVLAHSVGAVSVTAWVLDHTPPIRGLILATPAFRVKLYVPFAVPLLRLKQKLFGPGYVKSYVKSKVLTHDDEQASRYDADEFIFRQIAVNILLDLDDTSTRLLADAPAIRVPTLLLAAGSDWVVKLSAQQQFFRGLSSPVKQMQVYPGLFHALFHEKDRQLVINRVRDFILERFPEPSEDIAIDSAGQQTANGAVRSPGSGRPDDELTEGSAVPSVLPTEAGTPNRSEFSLLDADKSGHTKAEYDRLSAPGGLRFAPVRLALKTVGRLSKGIQLGWRTGFDSGTTLDYVYENKAQGITPLGRWIDRAYLNSIGWRGIRQRRIHLERLLGSVIETEHQEGERIHILDIAAGAGRYVIETMRSLPEIPASALLWDYKQENVDAATRLAKDSGLSTVTAVRGDAFDRAALAAVKPRPNIAIVSGLYELFPANEPVLNSLCGLAEALQPGGWLIYTNQPWHPQLEFIARVLTNREGKPWIMRRRTQAEIDELVKAAGFVKLSMDIDQWGIFTVSVART